MKRDFLAEPTKDELRRTMRARLREISPAARAEASLVICQVAAHLPAFIASRCVALFSPLSSEPDAHPLVEEAWARKKRVVLPLMIKQKSGPQLDWHEVTSWDDVVMPGPFGLQEPDPLRCPRIAVREIDCAFVPGLAFDGEGLRLGRGGGYYDYFLGHAPGKLARYGLMFSCQRVPKVPREAHDQALPGVVTEDGLVSFQVFN
jgi:5-formyltetrahydrofolate cyclo-ligase